MYTKLLEKTSQSEPNITDEREKKIITRRGCKHLEIMTIRNIGMSYHLTLCTELKIGTPPGLLMGFVTPDIIPSGWFDLNGFEDWTMTTVLNYVKN